jgi:hypothetical protein
VYLFRGVRAELISRGIYKRSSSLSLSFWVGWCQCIVRGRYDIECIDVTIISPLPPLYRLIVPCLTVTACDFDRVDHHFTALLYAVAKCTANNNYQHNEPTVQLYPRSCLFGRYDTREKEVAFNVICWIWE